MTEPLFHPRPPGLTAREIADLTAATPQAGADLDRRITGIAALDQAGPSDLTFLDNPKYAGQLGSTCAGICLASKRFGDPVPASVTLLVAREPYRAFVFIAQALFPDALQIGRAHV